MGNQTPNPFVYVSGAVNVGPFPTDVTARNAFRGPGARNFDFTLIKNIPISEKRSFQLRADLINAFNWNNYYLDGASAEVNNGTVNVFRSGSGPNGYNRNIQLAAKFIF